MLIREHKAAMQKRDKQSITGLMSERLVSFWKILSAAIAAFTLITCWAATAFSNSSVWHADTNDGNGPGDPSALETPDRYTGIDEITRFVAEIRRTPGVRRQIMVETTLSWGCPCPTWIFPFAENVTEHRYVMLLLAPGLDLDPAEFASPTMSYRMNGRFTGELVDGIAWAAMTPEPPPTFPRAGEDSAAAKEYWAEEGLVFIVESWCFVPEGDDREARSMRERGAEQCAN
jgi:hypothetical protein